MTWKLISLYTRLDHMMRDRARRDEGQGTLEYVGAVIIGAVLIVAVSKVINADDIASKVGQKVQDILGIGG